MKMGFRVALVSDAGTPTISDPGFKLTAAAHDEGIAVESLPGPCAVTTALSASGFPSERFTFMGYIPKTESDRLDLLLRAASLGQTVVFYDSPNRLIRSLQSILDVMGPQQAVFIGLELTKLHETHYRGSVSKVLV
jgi:16S rRNA (cytidine1402-2'-O)-methyltransferase